MKQMDKCGALALEMATLTGGLVQLAEALVADAEKSLLQANEDASTSEEQRREVENMIRDQQAQHTRLETLVRGLGEQLEEAKKSEKAWLNKVEDDDGVTVKGFMKNCLATVATPITVPAKLANAAANKLMGREQPPPESGPSNREMLAKAMDERKQIADVMLAQNAELAEVFSLLSTTSVREQSLSASIQLLTGCYKGLGRIVTTFRNVQMFWEAVAAHCKDLVKLKDDVNDVWEICGEYEGEVKEALFQSAVSWAALGKVNYDAHNALVLSKQITDQVMIALPSGDASVEQVEKLTSELLLSLDKSNQCLTDVKNACVVD